MPRLSRPSVVVWVVALSILVDTYVLRFLWWTSDIAVGQYLSGYFEVLEGTPALVLDARLHGSVVPDIGMETEGSLSVPPGRSIGLSLTEGSDFAIRVEDRDWAPHVLLGRRTALPDEKDRHGGSRLDDPLRLAWNEAGGMWAGPWQAVRSWRSDEADLGRLRERCAPGEDAEVIIRVASGIVRITYGACGLELASASMDTLVLLSGPAWVGVRKGGGWVEAWGWETRWMGVIALASLLKTAALAATLGWIPTLGIAVLGACLLLHADETAMLFVLLSFPLALAVAVIGSWRSHWKLISLGLLCLGAAGALFFTQASRGSPRPRVGAALTPGCLLVGYSAVRGDGLRQDLESGVWVEQGGMWDVLRAVPGCEDLQRYPRAAGTFTDMRDLLCGAESLVEEGGKVIFWGGSNDDFLWGRAWDRGLAPVLRLTRYAYARPNAAQWNELREAAEATSLFRLEEQIQVLEEALGCATRRGVRFLYVHDFVAWDLAGPRSEARRIMMQRRREVIRREHSFEDVAELVRDDAGVWIFNDYVHPSALGHQAIGAAIRSSGMGHAVPMR